MKKNIGYIYLLITFFCWGSIYIVSKYALADMGPITVAAIRYLGSAACLWILLKIRGTRRKVEKKHWKYLVFLGAVGYFGAIALQLAGTSLLTGSLASLINSMNPVMISLLAAVWLGEKITVKNVISIIVSLIGVYVILGGGAVLNPVGLICSALAVLLWSSASVVIRKISGAYDPVQTALYGMLIALIPNIPAAVIENAFVTQSNATVPALLACLYLAVIGTAVAHTCWNKSLSLLDAGTCSMFYPLQPLISAILGVVLLHEEITTKFIIGGILICIGVLITVMPGIKKRA